MKRKEVTLAQLNAMLEKLESLEWGTRKYIKAKEKLFDGLLYTSKSITVPFKFEHRKTLERHNLFDSLAIEMVDGIRWGQEDIIRNWYMDQVQADLTASEFRKHDAFMETFFRILRDKVPDKYEDYRAWDRSIRALHQEAFDKKVKAHGMYDLIVELLEDQGIEPDIRIPYHSNDYISVVLANRLDEHIKQTESMHTLESILDLKARYDRHGLSERFSGQLERHPASHLVVATFGALNIQDVDGLLAHYDAFLPLGDQYERSYSHLRLRQHIDRFPSTELAEEYVNRCIHVLNQNGMFKESNDLPIRNHIRNHVWDPVKYQKDDGTLPYWNDPTTIFWMLAYTILYGTRALDNTTLYEFRDSFATIDALTERLIVLLGEEWSDHIKRIVAFEYGHLYYRAQNNPYYDEWYASDRQELATIHKNVTHKLNHL